MFWGLSFSLSRIGATWRIITTTLISPPFCQICRFHAKKKAVYWRYRLPLKAAEGHQVSNEIKRSAAVSLVPKSERKQERLWCWVIPGYTSKRTGMPSCSPTLWSTYWYSKEIKWLVIQPFLDLWPVCISCTISVIYLIITKIANNFLIPMLKKKSKSFTVFLLPIYNLKSNGLQLCVLKIYNIRKHYPGKIIFLW